MTVSAPEAPLGRLLPAVTARPETAAVLEALKEGRGVRAGGLIGASFAAVLAAALRETNLRFLVLTAAEEEAEAVASDLRLFGVAEEVRRRPAPGGRGAEGAVSDGADAARLLVDLARGSIPRVVVASARAALAPVPDPTLLGEAILRLETGEPPGREDLVRRLATAGLRRVPLVEAPGDFAVRGDIVDIFDHGGGAPVRVEVPDDRVESLRRLDAATQRSTGAIANATLLLCSPSEGGSGAASFLGILPRDVVPWIREPAAVDQALETHRKRLEGEEAGGFDRSRAALAARVRLVATRLPAVGEGAVDFRIRAVRPEGSDTASALRTLERTTRAAPESVVVFANEAEERRFREVLLTSEDAAAAALRGRRIASVTGVLSEGFHWDDAAIAVAAHGELIESRTGRRPALRVSPRPESRAIEDFLDLREGDSVVHLTHGIARFLGMERVEKGGRLQDFLALEFRDGVRLYVPASKIEIVQKYVGGRGAEPELARLGSGSFAKRKDAVGKAVTDLAAELLEVQALRRRQHGLRFGPDSPWQADFEASFAWPDTEDQAEAVRAIRADMESDTPMDRLLCGDVGFGKTEVAIRAAFKSVMAGKQVAVLVPTTVLAQQHHATFTERLADYPVTVEVLSRFRTPAEQKAIVEALAAGRVDIAIGTHRLVQSDVVFRDLGLVIIDEEQRFGVEHKQALRRFRATVDVLTMTATPIPRTLHMGLVGLRDISSLRTPPTGRHAVHTSVVPRDRSVIRGAILRELDRGGQVFFVHNRVGTIEATARELRSLVPEARITVAHGQMPERLLESRMVEFVARRADILLCTTIIESGLDIPSANTILIDRADLYGLSELHQLRGRVGRWHDVAFALLLIDPALPLSDDAEKRLRSLEELSDLGAGFRIALRDLEIRGAGNILGAEQHGHIAAVGYELYCRLLDAAVKRLRNEPVIVPEEVEINIDFTAFLPESYIPDRRQRIEMYRKLGRCLREGEFEAVLGEMTDRFGRPPAEVADFISVSRIRALLERNGVERLDLMPGEGVALRSRHPGRLRRLVTGRDVPVREVQGRFLLLATPKPFRSPRELLRLLEAMFVREADPRMATGSGPADLTGSGASRVT